MNKMTIIGGKSIKEIVGKVVSTKMSKSIVIEVDSVKIHPIYKKRFTVTKKFYAHDENELAKEGDTVRIRQSKPFSKLKRWILIEVIK